MKEQKTQTCYAFKKKSSKFKDIVGGGGYACSKSLLLEVIAHIY